MTGYGTVCHGDMQDLTTSTSCRGDGKRGTCIYWMGIEVDDNDKIALDNILVRYGKTTLEEFLRAGYSVPPEGCFYDAEGHTVMASFFKDGVPMGQLCFFQVPSDHAYADLTTLPIGLVLLEDGPGTSTKASSFFKKIGFPLTKRNVLMFGGLYLFGCLMVAVNLASGSLADDPDLRVIAYLFLAVPLILLVFGVLIAGLNDLFDMLFRKMPFAAFVPLCLALWLALNYAGAAVAAGLRSEASSFWVIMIPVVLAYIIGGWAMTKIIMYYSFDKPVGSRYLLVHVPLILLIVICPYVLDRYFHIDIVNAIASMFSLSGVWMFFVVLVYVQLFLYGLVSLFGVLFAAILRTRPDRKHK